MGGIFERETFFDVMEKLREVLIGSRMNKDDHR